MKVETPKTCSAVSCRNEALSWSEPPICSEHVPDIDGWYAGVQQRLKTEPDENVRTLYGLLAHSEYMAAVSDNPVAEELYKDFENRAEPPKAIAFSVEHFVTALAHFYVLAAASGILGNLSYDVLKMFIVRLLGSLHTQPKPNDDRFDEIVDHEKYESVRKRFHLKMPLLEIDRETEKKVETRFRNIVGEGFGQDAELLFRPKRKRAEDDRTLGE
jgi:hypothetical protein